jgi:predicted nucleotidyltransferase
MKTQKVYGKENHSFNPTEEAGLLLNNEVKVTSPRSQFFGRTGIVIAIMADGRTLDVDLFGTNKQAFLDVTLVCEIKESYNWPKQEQSLGPIANSVVKDTI